MWTLLIGSLLLAPAADVEVRTLSGQKVAGILQSLSGATISIEASDGRKEFATRNLLNVALKSPVNPPSEAPSVWVDLADGSRVVATSFASEQGKASLKLPGGQSVSLPTSAISAVRLKEQSDKFAAQWADIVAAPRSGDVIVIRRDEAIDYQEGIIGDVTAETVQFTLDGDRIDVKRSRVEGFLLFHRQGAELPPAACQVVGRDGSRLAARQLALVDGQLEVTTSAGVRFVQSLNQVTELDFSLGKLRYLSDLEPQRIEQTPYFAVDGKRLDADRYYAPRFDQSFAGQTLRLSSGAYEKGIAVKSRTRLVYRLPQEFTRFEAVAGIDAAVAPLGDVHVTVRGEEGAPPLWEADIRGSDPPLPISIDIRGLKRLEIEVDFGAGGDVGDYLNLCEARIIQ
jgi:hypothetical protein